MIRRSEFDISVNGRTLTCLLAEPDRLTAMDDPALLFCLSGPRKKAIDEPPHSGTVDRFVRAGYRAVSIDLPCHGDRAGTQKPTGLAGMCAAVMAGEDPFVMFVEDGMACIDECMRRGYARAGRIYIYGTSRGGYCGLRLAAADHRVAAVVGMAPVTDWRRLHEFAPAGDDPRVAALALQHWAHTLAGRSVYLVIGNRDNRVGTECCTRFAFSLFETEARLGRQTSAVHLYIVSQSVGHRVSDGWFRRGDQFLLNRVRGDAQIDR